MAKKKTAAEVEQTDPNEPVRPGGITYGQLAELVAVIGNTGEAVGRFSAMIGVAPLANIEPDKYPEILRLAHAAGKPEPESADAAPEAPAAKPKGRKQKAEAPAEPAAPETVTVGGTLVTASEKPARRKRSDAGKPRKPAPTPGHKISTPEEFAAADDAEKWAQDALCSGEPVTGREQIAQARAGSPEHTDAIRQDYRKALECVRGEITACDEHLRGLESRLEQLEWIGASGYAKQQLKAAIA